MWAQLDEQEQNHLQRNAPQSEDNNSDVVLEIKICAQPNNIDSLTGLLCRSSFETQKLSKVFSQTVTAALLIDFDQFAKINDLYGRVTGDFILSLQAERLQQNYAHFGTLYRYEGDRFLLLVTGEPAEKTTPTEFETLAKKIQQTLNTTIKLSQSEVQASCCIGVALREDNMSLGLLATEAMIAAEEAKRQAPNNIQLHSGFNTESSSLAVH